MHCIYDILTAAHFCGDVLGILSDTCMHSDFSVLAHTSKDTGVVSQSQEEGARICGK